MKNQGVKLDFTSWRDELREIETRPQKPRSKALDSDESRSTRSACVARCATGSTPWASPIVIGDGGDIVATAAKIIPGQE